MSPAALFFAWNVIICYTAYPMLVLTNIPSHWNIFTKTVVIGFTFFFSFCFVAMMIGVVLIAYETCANFFPSVVGIDHYYQDEEDKDD